MRRAFVVLLVLCFVASFVVPAQADIFGKREKKLEAKAGAGISIEPNTILSGLTQIVDYLGTREGMFYDFNEEEVCNYAGATLYTYDPWSLALDIGMLNFDGGAATLDFNIGELMPSEGVPIMNLLKYLYVGGGIGARYIDTKNDNTDEKKWCAAYGVDAQCKFTF